MENSFKRLIKFYKIKIEEKGNNEETYKWEAIIHFQKHWDINSNDFYQMFKTSFAKKENLIFQNSFGFLDKLGKHFPEKLRELFILVYSDLNFDELYKTSRKKADEDVKLLREYLRRDNLNHQLDERTLSFLLVLKNPEKHYLYKSNVYNELCSFLKISPKKAGKKYAHFSEIGNSLLSIIRNDSELINLSHSFIPQEFNFKSEKLIFQDISYISLITLFSPQLEMFLEQSKENNLKTKHYVSSFSDLKVKVSFGQGAPARIPWISFLKGSQSTSNGIYPVFLLYKSINLLVLSYGVSTDNKPNLNWNLDSNAKTIEEYFVNNGFEKPKRYGSSFIFKAYDLNEKIDFIQTEDDLRSIISQYKSQLKSTNHNEITSSSMNHPLSIEKFHSDCENSGLTYSKKLITRYLASLVTKPFVLLSGLSGSGKTKLAQSFAQWICEDKEQYCMVPVGADWTNREPLLGYVNALNNNEYILPENGALQLLINASNNKEKPHFLILDEMNLSHVERYFADFLSIMESKEPFKLHSDKEEIKSTVPYQIKWPENLFIVGTVNIDETTYMFSPKVLDRANVIEFRVNKDDIKKYLNNPKPLKSLTSLGATMSNDFLNKSKEEIINNTADLNNTLIEFFEDLQKLGAEFGYRTASEIQILFNKISLVNPDYTSRVNDKIDIVIMQKLLPKLHGSRRKLLKTLNLLAGKCLEEIPAKIYNEKGEVIEKEIKIKYPLSFEKISRMYKNLIENGFASYAEA